MSSTLSRDLDRRPGSTYKNGGTSLPLGSEGSSHGSETSSVDNGQTPPEKVDVTIVFPNQSCKTLTVDYGKQMMDLLVQVTASHQLSPATHTFQLVDEDSGRPIEYLASQPVGTIGVDTLYVTEKKTDQQRKRENKPSHQPFEITHRLTVNLPRNQKMIARVSPKASLAEVFKLVCTEKNFDPYKYELRHPSQPDMALNMAHALGHYGLTEITVVPVGADVGPSRNSTVSLHDSSYLNSSPMSSTANTLERKKKKGGIFSLFRKKEGKFKPGEANYTASTSTLPTSSDATWNQSSSSQKQLRSAARSNYPTLAKSTPSLHSGSTDQSRTTSSIRENNNQYANKLEQQRSVQSGSFKSGSIQTESVKSETGNEEGKGATHAPRKPPRGTKKRAAPPPPTQTPAVPKPAVSPQISPAARSQADSGIVTSPNNETVNASSKSSDPHSCGGAHSRTSSRSSGFDSTGSPLEGSAGAGSLRRGESNNVALSANDVGQLSKSAAKPAATSTLKKRRAPPPPTGVQKLEKTPETGESSAKPASEMSHDQTRDQTNEARDQKVDQSGLSSQNHQSTTQNSTHSPNQKARPAQPIFTAPPPPDTPPPDESPRIFPTYENPLLSSMQTNNNQSEPSTPHNQSNTYSLDLERSNDVSDLESARVAVADSSTQVRVTARDSLSSVGHGVSRMSSMCSCTSGSDLSPESPKEFPLHIGETPKLIKENPSIAELGVEHRAEVQDLTNQITQLTDTISQSEVTTQLSPRSEDNESQSKGSLQTDPKEDNDSLDNYEFAHSTHEPALADSADSGVVLLKASSFTKNTAPSAQNENISTTTPKSSQTNQKEADQMSIDSLDLLDSPDIKPTTNTLLSQNRNNKSHEVPDEIHFEQTEVSYVAPDDVQIVTSHTQESYQDLREQKSTSSIDAVVSEKETKPVASVESFNERSEKTPVSKPEERSETLIFEKPKLSHDIQAALARKDNAEEPKGIKVRPHGPIDPNQSSDKQYSQFMSYVESAKSKTQTVEPQSPKPVEEGNKNAATSFFVGFEETRNSSKSPNQGAQREDSFNRGRSPRKNEISPRRNEQRKGERYDFTITTMEYKRERDWTQDSDPNRTYDTSPRGGSFRSGTESYDRDGFRIPQGLPPKSGTGRTTAARERAAALRASSMQNIYEQPFGNLREAYEKNQQREQRAAAREQQLQQRPLSPLSVSTTFSSAYRSSSGDSRGNSPAGSQMQRVDSQNTVILTSRGDNAGSVTSSSVSPSKYKRGARDKGMFLGPRPWGARHSEPSVRDVRAALAIHQAKEDDTVSETHSGNVRKQVSTIGFSPDSEHESDSFLEEKSISMIALPAEKRSVAKGGLRLSARAESMENLGGHSPSAQYRRAPSSGMKYAQSTDNVLAASMGSSSATKGRSATSPASADRDKTASPLGQSASRKSLQNQYDELQQKFSKWQQQLLENESLITSKTSESKIKPVAESRASTKHASAGNDFENQRKGATGSGTTSPARARFNQRHGNSSEFNRRITIDTGDARKSLLEEIERRGRMFDKYTHTSETRKARESTSDNATSTSASAKHGLTQTHSLDSDTPSTLRQFESSHRRHGDRQRFSSLTEGAQFGSAQTGAHNGAVASQVSMEDIMKARAKLRQNSRESTSSSTHFSGNSETTRSESNSRSGDSRMEQNKRSGESRQEPNEREGNAPSSASEKKKEISLELQYFLNRNKERSALRSERDSSETSNTSSKEHRQPEPDPAYSGRTYGRKPIDRSSESYKQRLTDTSSGNMSSSKQLKSNSRVFGAVKSSTEQKTVDASSGRTHNASRFSSMSSTDLSTNKSEFKSHDTSSAKPANVNTSGLGSRSLIDFISEKKSQSGTRASSPPRHSTPIKSSLRKTSSGGVTSASSTAPVPPPPPPVVAEASGKTTSAGSARWNAGSRSGKSTAGSGGKKVNSLARYEQENKLDPREALMIAIRNTSKRSLNQVSVAELNQYSKGLDAR